jgi:hypothetical protein
VKILYAVFQEAVYRHGCVGIFESLDEAQKAADNAAHNMGDDGHHHYDVVPFEMNKIYAVIEKLKAGDFFEVNDPEPIYSAQGARTRRYK